MSEEKIIESNNHAPLDKQLEHEIVEAVKQARSRTAEVIITSLFVTIGLFFYGIGLTSLWTVLILLFGALWNFFTDSNKLFACIFAFCLCIPYALICIDIGMMGQAFLHLLFYLPTQLIYYIENQHQSDISILKNKKLEYSGIFGTTLSAIVLMLGVGLVLYNLGDTFFIFDASSVVLLAISVFLVNGRYREYWAIRLFAVGYSAFVWLFVGFILDWVDGTIIFTLLFIMYFIADFIKYMNWLKHNKEIEKQRKIN